MQVDYISHMGSDLTVCNAARVSFKKESKLEDGKLSEQDQKLILYLAKHSHWTPSAHVQITLREKVPIFVARQRFKHMVGFTYNEVSRRYVDDTPEFYQPDVWRGKPVNAKQGSSDEVITHLEWEVNFPYEPPATMLIADGYKEFLGHAEWLYSEMIKNGVAPEQARMVLPQSMYTEFYCTGSLAAWARAYKLRIDKHAQKEIQDLAKMWGSIIGSIDELKYSWSALIKE